MAANCLCKGVFVCECLLACLTIGIMGVLHPCHSAAAKHHLVLRQRARLVREDVLHLAEILGDIQSSALQVRVRLLVVQIHVLMDEVHLADLDNFNRHKKGDRYQHLGEDRVFVRKEIEVVIGFSSLLCIYTWKDRKVIMINVSTYQVSCNSWILQVETM